ncbi:MAG: hypothetical protein ABR998_03940 [Gemmatimonadales bacterium]|jgi:hypothetical protein
MRRSGVFKTLGRRVALVAVTASMFVATAPAQPARANAPVPASTATVSGRGYWSTITCIACAAGFFVGGGMTAGGLVAMLAANPNIAIACVSACVDALS